MYEQFEDKEANTFYLPKCLCILSHHPFFNTFKEFLAFLYTTYIANNLDVSEPIERILDNFLFEIPMTNLPTAQVSFKYGTVLRHLSTNPFLVDFPLESLFQTLSIDSIIRIIGFICTERSIVFVSQNTYLLGLILQSFLWILQPIKWCHTCFPLLPPSLFILLEAPQPFLIGICGADLYYKFRNDDEIVAVYLDEDKIVPTFSSDPCPFPSRIAEAFKKSIRGLLAKITPDPKHPDLHSLGKTFEYISLCTSEGTSITTCSIPAAILDSIAIKTSFLLILQEMIGNYSSFAREESKEQGKVSYFANFDSEKYTGTKPTKEQPFFKKFSHTQLFEQFGEELSAVPLLLQAKYLIDIIEKVTPAPTGDKIIQTLATAPDPDYCISKKNRIIKHVLNKCENFPAKLNNSLFLNSQSIPWESMKISYDEEESIEKKNPLNEMLSIESAMKMNFARLFVEYMRKNEVKAKKFWRISKNHKSSQPNSGSRSLSSRNNNKPRSVLINNIQ